MRALIVDDSPAARAQARLALEDVEERLGLSIDVQEAANGVEALRSLSMEPVDLLIVDMHMPDMTGLEVLAFSKQSGAHARAVVVSTGVSSRERARALESGAVGFIEKPITGALLSEALAGLGVAS